MSILPDRRYSGRIMKMAFPAIAGLSSQMIVSIIDTAMVGRLDNSEVALAAMGLGVLATWTLTSFFSSLATGTHILVARRFGQGKHTAAGIILNNSILLSFVLGILFGILGFFFSYDVINLFSSDEQVARAAGEYIKFRSLGLPFFLLGVSYRGFFYGIGHTKVFMFSAIIMYICNIVFNYLLIFGMAGFPQMGIAGAGLAASIGMAVGMLFFVAVTFFPDYRKKYRYYSVFAIGLEYIKPIVRISLPVSFQNILILLGFLVFVAIAGIFGTTQQAATQVVISALFLSFMPCFGFGIATQTLVGNELGNDRPNEAYKYGIETAKIGTVFTILVGILFFAIPDSILRIITPNETVIAVARPLLLLAGAAQVAYGAGIILANALQAAGATLYVMFLEIVTHWIIFLPLSYILGRSYGIVGAWLTLPVYIAAYTTLAYLKFRSRTWTELKV
ncbi:MAG: MATE family multidrug resistance protein [Bacteroidetes bacterium]|nr:MATE family multidrug resistance protein [Bacteroidota bacterium]